MNLELLAVFGTSFVVGLSGALMPGPLVTLAIAESARSGFARGPAIVLGHAIVELAAVLGLLFGLSRLMQSGSIAGALSLVGGLVLLWMGGAMARGAWLGKITLAVGGSSAETAPAPAALVGDRSDRTKVALTAAWWSPARLPISSVVRGGAVSVANPYWLLWWATIGAAYVGRSLTLGAAGLAAFYVGHILSDLGWISLVSLAVASGRRALSQRIYSGLILFCASALALLGLYFAYFGVCKLLAASGP